MNDGLCDGCARRGARRGEGAYQIFTPEHVGISIFGGGKESKDTKDT